MKKALLGLTGALLATSAFTAANAAVVSRDGTAANVYTATNVAKIAAETLGTVPATFGPAATVLDTFTVNAAYTLAFSTTFPAAQNFAVRLTINNAGWNGASAFTADTIPSGSGSCATFNVSATSLIFTCSTTGNVTGFQLISSAQPFVTTAATVSGTNVTLDAKVSPDTNFLSDVNTEAPVSGGIIAQVVEGIVTSVGTTPTVTINQAGTPEFSTFAATTGGSATAARVGTFTAAVNATATPLVDRTFTTFNTAAVSGLGGTNGVSGGTITITHPAIADAAITAVSIGNTDAGAVAVRTKAANAASFNGSTVTFTLTDAEAEAVVAAGASTGIYLRASGTASVIAYAAGTATVDLTTGGALASTAPLADEAAVNGNLAALSRGGFVSHHNNFYTLTSGYESFIRIVNNSATAGTATLQIWDAGTGTLVCTATTPSIAPQQSLEASRATIVSLCGAQLPATIPTYLNARVTGTFGGYSTHVVWNNRTTVTDLSGQR